MAQAQGGMGKTRIPSTGTRVVELQDALAVARFLLEQSEMRCGFASAMGFEGYGNTKRGDKVLVCTDTHYDPQVAEVLSAALRERGARVDQVVVEAESDREFTEVDEIAAMMLRGSWKERPRWRFIHAPIRSSESP